MPNKALQPTGNPLRGSPAAELGRWAVGGGNPPLRLELRSALALGAP